MITTGVFTVKKLAIWHAIAPKYGATTVIIMDMLPWTALIRYWHLAHWHAEGLTPMTGMKDPPLDATVTPDTRTMVTRIDLDSVAPNLTPVTTAIEVVATRTPIEVAPDHSTDLPITVSHITGALVPTAIITTHLTTDLHLIEMFPEMTADLDTNHGNNTTDWPKDPHPPHRPPSWKHQDNRHKQVTIDDPPSEYYSSDDNDSDSEDDLN